MADHLRQRTARHRAFCRFEVIVDGTVCDAGFREMIREQFRLDRCEAAFIALEPECHLMVQGAAAVA